MQEYKSEFIEFLVRAGVLTFGEFTTKSGRQTPYFINTGNYRLGSQLGQLGRYYAAALGEHLGGGFDNLYGPAYKGIALAVSTAIALGQGGHEVSVTYNRKEAKDHGETGTLIGHQYDGGERVVIIEDVITAGTSVRESMEILAAQGKPKVVGVMVSVDRAERGKGAETAMAEISREFGVPVFAIVNVREIIEWLHNRKVDGRVYIDDGGKQKMEGYLEEYGAKDNK